MHLESRTWMFTSLFILVILLSFPIQANTQIIKRQNLNFYATCQNNKTQQNTADNSPIETNTDEQSGFLAKVAITANSEESTLTFDSINETSASDNSSTALPKIHFPANSNNIGEAEPQNFAENSEKNVITFNAGEFDLNQTLQVNSSTLVFGAQNSVLRFSGDSYLNLTGDNITLCGLIIEGDGLNDEFGIRANGNFITIENCSVSNIGVAGLFGFGVTFEYGSQSGSIINNQVKNTGLDGIHLRGNMNTTVSNNTVIDSNDDGIASIFGHDNLIINNFIDRKGATNLSGNGIYAADKEITIQNNVVQNTPLNGIIAESFQDYQATGINIINNTIKNAGMPSADVRCGGILLNYACSSNVTGNTIDGSLYDGIRIYNGSSNCVEENRISNNFRAENNWGGGIVLEYQSSYNFVLANKISNETYVFVETGLGVDHNTISFADVQPDEIYIEGLNSILLP